MTIEAIILSCGLMTMEQSNHIRQHWLEYDNRAVACAIERWKREQPKPKPLKSLDDVPTAGGKKV